ncbi:hypothetical protein EBR66_06425 [bacterium]|nr:hypothetical protein [bacterium]
MPSYLGRIDGELGHGDLYADGCGLIIESDCGGEKRIDLSQLNENTVMPEKSAQVNINSIPSDQVPIADEYSEIPEEPPIELEYGPYASRLALTVIPVADVPVQFIMPDAIRRVLSIAQKYPGLKIASYDDNTIYFVDDPIAYPNYYEDYLLEISNAINSNYELLFILGISVTPISKEDFEAYYGASPIQNDQGESTMQVDLKNSFLEYFIPEGYVEPPTSSGPVPVVQPWQENPDDYYFQDGEYRLQSEIEANPFYQDCADGSTQQSMRNDLIWAGDRWELQEPCWDHGGSLQAMIDAEGRISYEQSPSYGEAPPMTEYQKSYHFGKINSYYWLRKQGYDDSTANAILLSSGYV